MATVKNCLAARNDNLVWEEDFVSFNQSFKNYGGIFVNYFNSALIEMEMTSEGLYQAGNGGGFYSSRHFLRGFWSGLTFYFRYKPMREGGQAGVSGIFELGKSTSISVQRYFSVNVPANSNKIMVHLGDNTNERDVVSADELPNDVESEVLIRWDGTDVDIYINGVLSANESDVASGAIALLPMWETISSSARTARSSIGSIGAKGFYKKMMLWGSALTNDQVDDVFNGEYGEKPTPSSYFDASSLIVRKLKTIKYREPDLPPAPVNSISNALISVPWAFRKYFVYSGRESYGVLYPASNATGAANYHGTNLSKTPWGVPARENVVGQGGSIRTSHTTNFFTNLAGQGLVFWAEVRTQSGVEVLWSRSATLYLQSQGAGALGLRCGSDFPAEATGVHYPNIFNLVGFYVEPNGTTAHLMVNGEVVASGEISGAVTMSAPVVWFNYISSFTIFENRGRLGTVVDYGSGNYSNLSEFQEFVKNEWNSKAELVGFYDDLSDAEVGAQGEEGGYITGTVWGVDTGVFSIQEEEINGENTKVIACSGAGSIWCRLEDNAMGNVGVLECYFNNSVPEGGSLGGFSMFGWSNSRHGGVEGGNADMGGYFMGIEEEVPIGVRLANSFVASTLMSGAAGTAPISNWHKLRMERKPNGVMRYYQDDVLITAASGANPSAADVTLFGGKYIVISMQEGDKVALIKHKLGVTIE